MVEIIRENIKKLLDEITVENINMQIAEGWINSSFIAEYIIGTDVWKRLPEWDRKILAARVHRVVVENKLL